MSTLAALPALAPPPFQEPKFLSARRIAGAVSVPQSHAQQPPSLERCASVSGNILLIREDNNNINDQQHAYLLQRKIGNSARGSVRVGYVVTRNSGDSNDGNSNTLWDVEVEPHTGQYKMVTITIFAASYVFNSKNTNNNADPITELSALQMIATAATNTTTENHVEGTLLIATDDVHVYSITPYYKEGSLYDYCVELKRDTLNENDARFFFRQICKVRTP
jgi:serine/threonine protein kinase